MGQDNSVIGGRRADSSVCRSSDSVSGGPLVPACDLYRYATQTVFGEGPPSAPVVMVGEQPGDREDIEGRPFVGPAGRVLEQAMEEAGLNPAQVYLTNAVKHFR